MINFKVSISRTNLLLAICAVSPSLDVLGNSFWATKSHYWLWCIDKNQSAWSILMVFVSRQTPLISLWEWKGAGTVFENFDFYQIEAVDIWVYLLTNQLKFFSILTDWESVKILTIIVKVHPESSVFEVFNKPELLLQLRCPAVRLITPVSLPLESTPGVSELNQLFDLPMLVKNFSSVKKAVYVLWYQT